MIFLTSSFCSLMLSAFSIYIKSCDSIGATRLLCGPSPEADTPRQSLYKAEHTSLLTAGSGSSNTCNNFISYNISRKKLQLRSNLPNAAAKQKNLESRTEPVAPPRCNATMKQEEPSHSAPPALYPKNRFYSDLGLSAKKLPVKCSSTEAWHS